MILGLHRRLTWFVHRLYAIACGEDIKKFIMVTNIHGLVQADLIYF